MSLEPEVSTNPYAAPQAELAETNQGSCMVGCLWILLALVLVLILALALPIISLAFKGSFK